MKDSLVVLMMVGAIIGAAVSVFCTTDVADTSGLVIRVVGGWVCGMGGGMALYVLLARLRARGFFAPYL